MNNNQASEIIKHLKSNMQTASTSEECLKHTIYDVKEKEDIISPVKLLDFKDGEGLKCPQCELDKQNEEYINQLHIKRAEHRKKVRKETLFNKSIYDDKSLAVATFKNYVNEFDESEVSENRKLVLKIIQNYANRKVFTTMLKGRTGVGKSHLALSILKNLNEMIEDVSCVFVSTRKMIDLIIDSYNNPDSIYTKQRCIDLCVGVDFLVLDDLGAETGAIDTNKTASDHTQGIITAILEGRQDKATIITTNLSRDAIADMYDEKLVSRALKNIVPVIFENTKDKRIKEFELEDF